MKYAVIEDGGKQYKVVEGGTIDIDFCEYETAEQVELDRVLLIVDDEDIKIGTPLVEKAVVNATVVEQVKAPKIIVFKYKPRIRYRVKRGHRQKYTRLMIDTIKVE